MKITCHVALSKYTRHNTWANKGVETINGINGINSIKGTNSIRHMHSTYILFFLRKKSQID